MMRLPWHGKTAPHAVLDILRGCNCRCANCYNATAPLNCKSLDALKEELVLLRSARNLSAISLSGGEPLTQREIAAAHGISRSYISRIEKAALLKLREELEK